MGVAADCEYTSQYGGSQNATQQILTNWNTASALYKVSAAVCHDANEGEGSFVRPSDTEHIQCQPWDRRATNSRLHVRLPDDHYQLVPNEFI